MLMQSNLGRASLFSKDSYHSLCHMHTISPHIYGQSLTGIKRNFCRWIDSTIQIYFHPGNHVLFVEIVKIIFFVKRLGFKRWILCQSSVAWCKSHSGELERLIWPGVLYCDWMCLSPCLLDFFSPSVTVTINMKTPQECLASLKDETCPK